MQQFDLIIVGGGLAGASLAVALRDTALRIALIESRPPSRPQGWDARVYAISPANAAFLERIGAWRHLDTTRMAPIRGMEIRGDAGGELAFSAYDTGVPELGWILESSLMACEFWEAPNVRVTLHCSVRRARSNSALHRKLQFSNWTMAARFPRACWSVPTGAIPGCARWRGWLRSIPPMAKRAWLPI